MKKIVLLFVLVLTSLAQAGVEKRLLRCPIDQDGLSHITVTEHKYGLMISEVYIDGKEISLPLMKDDLESGRIMLTPLKDKYRKLTKASKGWALITGSVMNWTSLKCEDSL